MTPDYINTAIAYVHTANVNAGWWDDPNRCLVECLQLVSTEVAEATEGARKNLPDTHLPHWPMEIVELADVLIRLFDIGGKLGLIYHPTGAFPGNWRDRSVGFLHFQITRRLVPLCDRIADGDLVTAGYAFSRLVDAVIFVAKLRGFWEERRPDLLEQVIGEKLAYNARRADHTREVRAAAGGKKF